MALRLTITQWNDPSSEYTRNFVIDSIAIGRARSCDICLPDMSVSTRHAEIRMQGTDYVIVDLGSVNPTEVQGKTLVAHRPHRLNNGEIIAIAGFRLRFHRGIGPGPAEGRTAATEQARKMLSRMLSQAGSDNERHVIVVTGGPSKGKRFEIARAPSTHLIGRGRDCDIQVDDTDVSRYHAEILVESDGIFIRDRGSRNGISVNRDRVEAHKLELGDKIYLGRSVLELEHPIQRSLNQIFESPEEETSSYIFADSCDQNILDNPQKVESPGSRASISLESQVSTEPDSVLEVAEIPVGPADPLVDANQMPATKRTTGTIPLPEIEPGSDIGLIIVGAIIIVASVIGLIYLFT